MRLEKDSLGEMQIPENALYGIHSLRASSNFPDYGRFPVEWYKAMASVKRACYSTVLDYYKKVKEKYNEKEISKLNINERNIEKLLESATECAEGNHYEQFIVPAISGGAGTSINMNMNEILCNSALIKSGYDPGEYNKIDPIEDANIFQSTNDVVPTALKVAVMYLLNELEGSINNLRTTIEKLEKKYRNSVRIGYTQMQEAVPTTFGRLFSTYADALSRDWWRISKCFERIKVVNLGGSAIGTSLTVPQYFAMEAARTLHKITGLPVTRGENLSDVTSNLDPFVEVHGIIKAHAVNLEKITNDLRLLASDLTCSNDILLPNKQVGSSIMPGKINPVIPEFVISCAHKIYSNDILITELAAQGCLELNAYLPVIGSAIIESLKLLIASDETLKNNLFDDLNINTSMAEERLYKSPSITTVLLPYIGYNKASELAKYMKSHNLNIFEANRALNLINHSKLKKVLSPKNLIQGGFRISDLNGE